MKRKIKKLVINLEMYKIDMKKMLKYYWKYKSNLN